MMRFSASVAFFLGVRDCVPSDQLNWSLGTGGTPVLAVGSTEVGLCIETLLLETNSELGGHHY